jgi:hypothetical protein
MADLGTEATRVLQARSERDAAAVSADLLREFERAFLESFGSRARTDPMIAVLFQAVATQVSRIYDDAEQVFPERVIDDIMDAIGLPAASAVPAQTVVAFSEIETREVLEADVPLIGYSRTGEELCFLPDISITLVPAALRFAAVAEGGQLQTVSGATLDEHGTPLPYQRVSVPPQRAPMLLLAIEATGGDVSGLGVHFELASVASDLESALVRSAWHVLDAQGHSSEQRTMLPNTGRGGSRALRWSAMPRARVEFETAEPQAQEVRLPDLPVGPYGPHVYVLPPFTPEHCSAGRPPALLEPRLHAMIPEEHRGTFSKPLTWIAIPLPAGLTDVAQALRQITLNAVTASNIEVLNETIALDRRGTSMNLRPEGLRGRHLLGVRSVHGERGDRYLPESELGGAPGTGRYRIDRNHLHFRPAVSETGRVDRIAAVRLLVTDGERGNRVDPGRISRLGVRMASKLLRVSNLVPSRGGTNPPDYPRHRLRLAEALRARERAVTASDFEVIAKAFDPRLSEVRVSQVGTLVDRCLQPVQLVECAVSELQLGDAESEAPRLRDLLERHLQARALIGQVVRVKLSVRR